MVYLVWSAVDCITFLLVVFCLGVFCADTMSYFTQCTRMQ